MACLSVDVAGDESVLSSEGTEFSGSGAVKRPSNSDKRAGWHWALVAPEQLAEPGRCPAGQAAVPSSIPTRAAGQLLKGAFVCELQGQSPSIRSSHN